MLKQQRRQDTQCRFCLGEKDDFKNPFLSPCDCKGSIEFVHLHCLNIWRNKNHERNYTACNLCNADYIVPSEYSLESIPSKHALFVVLDFPILSNLGAHYIWIVSAGLYYNNKNAIQVNYKYLQIFFHVYYIFSVLLYFHVTKRRRYFMAWFQEYRYLFFPLYGFLLGVAALSAVPYLWFVPSIYMSMFWHLHIHILKQMNRDDLQALRESNE